MLPYFLFMLLLVAVFMAHSQGKVSGSNPFLASDTPIDGGFFLIISAGLLYGGKILYPRR